MLIFIHYSFIQDKVAFDLERITEKHTSSFRIFLILIICWSFGFFVYISFNNIIEDKELDILLQISTCLGPNNLIFSYIFCISFGNFKFYKKPKNFKKNTFF